MTSDFADLLSDLSPEEMDEFVSAPSSSAPILSDDGSDE
jgi:hypothetical protein